MELLPKESPKMLRKKWLWTWLKLFFNSEQRWKGEWETNIQYLHIGKKPWFKLDSLGCILWDSVLLAGYFQMTHNSTPWMMDSRHQLWSGLFLLSMSCGSPTWPLGLYWAMENFPGSQYLIIECWLSLESVILNTAPLSYWNSHGKTVCRPHVSSEDRGNTSLYLPHSGSVIYVELEFETLDRHEF